MDFDLDVRAAVYRHFAERASAPTVNEMAAATGAGVDEVRQAYERLYARRMLVLMPDGESIRMAPPFSGIETMHEVRALGRRYFANCAWDSFGIAAALHAEADVRSRCGHSGAPLELHLTAEGPPHADWIFHAAVPAAHWWRDIVYT